MNPCAIDVHHHYVPESLLEEAKARGKHLGVELIEKDGQRSTHESRENGELETRIPGQMLAIGQIAEPEGDVVGHVARTSSVGERGAFTPHSKQCQFA